jgi:hypothetical protein
MRGFFPAISPGRPARVASLSLIAGLVAVAWGVGARGDAEPEKVIPAHEAQLHVDERCTAEMTVRSSKNAGPRREYYLDSEENFQDDKNLAVVISYDHAGAFKAAGIDDPADYYKGKTIRVTGKVIREAEQVRIRVEDPKQIRVVEPAAG